MYITQLNAREALGHRHTSYAMFFGLEKKNVWLIVTNRSVTFELNRPLVTVLLHLLKTMYTVEVWAQVGQNNSRTEGPLNCICLFYKYEYWRLKW